MQTWAESVVEVVHDLFWGFVFAYVIQHYIVRPLYDLPHGHQETFGITLIFTVATFIRRLILRRYHDWITRRRLARAES